MNNKRLHDLVGQVDVWNDCVGVDACGLKLCDVGTTEEKSVQDGAGGSSIAFGVGFKLAGEGIGTIRRDRRQDSRLNHSLDNRSS